MSNQQTPIQDIVSNQQTMDRELIQDQETTEVQQTTIGGIENLQIPNSNFVAVVVLTCLCIMQFQA